MVDKPIGERVAIVETRVSSLEGEVLSLRNTRHEHAGRLQEVFGRLENVEESQNQTINRIVPDLTSALDSAVKKIEAIRRRLDESQINYAWWVKLAAAVYVIGSNVATGVLLWLVTRGR